MFLHIDYNQYIILIDPFDAVDSAFRFHELLCRFTSRVSVIHNIHLSCLLAITSIKLLYLRNRRLGCSLKRKLIKMSVLMYVAKLVA